MTREEIKDELYRMLSDVVNGGCPIRNNTQKGRYREAVKEAIKALEQEPCDDCISRAEAQESISAAISLKENPHQIWKRIQTLPSVSPQQRTGRWIAQDIHNCHTDFKCSECGYIHSFMHLYGKPTADYTYCPNCACKMEVEE